MRIVSHIPENYPELVKTAVDEVRELEGKITRVPERKVQIPDERLRDEPTTDRLRLSEEALSILARTIENAAAEEIIGPALEMRYQGSSDIAVGGWRRRHKGFSEKKETQDSAT